VTGLLPSYVARLSRRGRERRAHVRVAKAIAVRVRATSRDGRRTMLHEGEIADLHAFGASLRCDRPIGRGWRVVILLPFMSRPVEVPAGIVYRRKMETAESTVYLYGLAFHRPIQPTETTTVATPALAGPKQTFITQGADLMTARIVPTPQWEVRRASFAPTLLTIKGAAAKIEGTFEVEESIEVQCDISGTLRVGGTLVIGERARVSADVMTVNAIIKGSYMGTLKASGSVEIAATGRVTGTLDSRELVIVKGATFTGAATHTDKEMANQSESAPLLPRPDVPADVEKPIPVTRLVELDLGQGIYDAGLTGAQRPVHGKTRARPRPAAS
jgi:cytoskeletal protein CcmA (bactofilin family)